MSRARNAAAAKVTDAAPVFAALGDATRLKLVARLCGDGPLSIAPHSNATIGIAATAADASGSGNWSRHASKRRAGVSIRFPISGTQRSVD